MPCMPWPPPPPPSRSSIDLPTWDVKPCPGAYSCRRLSCSWRALVRSSSASLKSLVTCKSRDFSMLTVFVEWTCWFLLDAVPETFFSRASHFWFNICMLSLIELDNSCISLVGSLKMFFFLAIFRNSCTFRDASWTPAPMSADHRLKSDCSCGGALASALSASLGPTPLALSSARICRNSGVRSTTPMPRRARAGSAGPPPLPGRP
mmetsp:Transcript_32242/g.97446  ORF Transcript_32242/g.97446 Transcript_32242/m.97446 type:complete len:206 (+) Transcript_32242:363-980(+)